MREKKMDLEDSYAEAQLSGVLKRYNENVFKVLKGSNVFVLK